MPSTYAVATSSPPDGLSRSRAAAAAAIAAAAAATPPPGIPRPGSSTSSAQGYNRSPRLPGAGNGKFNSPNYSYRAAGNAKVQHISSALARAYSPQPATSADRPPRTSSLLPPPRIIPNYTNVLDADPVHPEFNGSSLTVSSVPEAVNPRDPKHSRKSSSGPFTHSRSSSLGGLSDTLRTLNRWSSSTASSRVSPQRPERVSRRMSVDVLGQSTPASLSNSPKRLQKARPSTSGGSPRPGRQASVRRGSPASALPAAAVTLPSIRTLSPLQPPVRTESISLAGTPLEFPLRPSLDDDGGYFSNAFSTSQEQSTPAAYARRNGAASAAADSPDPSTMPPSQNGEAKGHTRSRSQTAKGSGDASGSSRSRDRPRQPSQKAMLSRALQKANQAVQLDNAQSYEVARDSYQEACDILQHVLQRTPGDEDQKKLEAIRKTYADRIVELDALIPDGGPEEKALPARPQSYENYPGSSMSPTNDSGEEPIIETATVTRIVRDPAPERPAGQMSYSVPTTAAKRRLESGTTPSPAIGSAADGRFTVEAQRPSAAQASIPRQNQTLNLDLTLRPPVQNEYMPPPLSPRRPPSPNKATERSSPVVTTAAAFSALPKSEAGDGAIVTHLREMSQETTSWLDPIDESGGSTASSVHSRTSSLRLKRKHIRTASGDTEAEFDAALDDAIEAAYNDGYEPEMDPLPAEESDDPEESIAKALRKVELARQRVRESEREAMELANERERRLRAQLQNEEEAAMASDRNAKGEFYDGTDSETEERMLEEMTRGFAIEDFALNSKSKRPIPRESDSSGFTSRTWHSSTGSNPPTASTVLSSLSESTVTPSLSKGTAPPMPPPTGALPPQPGTQAAAAANANRLSVRSRRLSGQNPKQLKIETAKLGQPAQPVTAIMTKTTTNSTGPQALPQLPQQPKTAGYIVQQRQALSAAPNKAAGPTVASARAVPTDTNASLPTPTLPQVAFPDGGGRSGSPSFSKPGLRKNMSSSSLKSMKSRNLSVSNGDEVSDLSPGTPMSAQLGSASRLPAMPSLPSNMAASLKDRGKGGAVTGGLYLFEMGFHSPTTPGSPDAMASEPPVPLEPCPADTMLRPFWLMRCLYQTLAHPRGGYLSTRLFVPREAWRVRGVKLKGVDDKVAQCDLLTAALQRLARVDTCDADAVLEEMQALEGVLEVAQAALARKLGNGEVGVQGSWSLFRDATPGLEVDSAGGGGSAVPRSASMSGNKSASGGGGSSFSWRRLRSKGSSAGLGAGGGGSSKATTPVDGSGNGAAPGSNKEVLLPTLPMTSNPTSRPSKRDYGAVNFSGPNAVYMAALAKLFDAAQAVDQIARQVEDPGLRHADKTQVGLELCTRHAAEFFAFYICRFALSDLSMLLDKYVKRASEWVLA